MPASSLRGGWDYQDIVALDLVVEMLEHPDRYQWIQVEADEAGSLDDVTALCRDGGLVARQVKFSTDPASPDDSWTWEMLLKEEQGKRGPRPSLLAKWHKSLDQLSALGPLGEAALISNRNASLELKGTLSVAGLVDFDKISARERPEIIRQLGNEDAARSFFAQFHFYVDKPNLAEMEAAVLKRFRALSGTEHGWLALKDEMHIWARDRVQPSPDGKITLGAARRAAQWYSLQSLPQRFEVPPDYVLPSQSFYDQLVADLTKPGSGCIVLAAPPGLGKSTFLSYLVHQLQERDIPVIRHHYFLSLTDRSGDRFSHLKVSESLMSDLQRAFPEALGEEGKRNPNPQELGKWLEVGGNYFSAKGKALFVVVDGLDHVFRENRSIDELNRLFQYLLSPPEGVIILVGTQPVNDDLLPSRLFRFAPRLQWKSLPSLDRLAVRHWLEYHTQEIGTAMPAHFQEHVLEELTDAFLRNLREDANLPPATGQCLMVKHDLIDSYTSKSRSRFCWIWRLTGYQREHSYQEYKTFSIEGQIGASNVIWA